VITTLQENINHVLEIHQPQLAQNNAQPVQEELITLIKKKENHLTLFLELKKFKLKS